MDFKIFNKWDAKVEVKDPGLNGYINLSPVLVPRKSHGRHSSQQFYKSSVNIVERLMNRMMVPGHKGKKHKYTSGVCGGSGITNYSNVKKALEIVEQKTKKNPIEVLVKAIENAALREEVTSYQMGSIMARKAVVTSPQRRIDMALRFITQGAYSKSHGSKKNIANTLADEIILTFNGDRTATAIQEKERLEREAEGAR